MASARVKGKASNRGGTVAVAAFSLHPRRTVLHLRRGRAEGPRGTAALAECARDALLTGATDDHATPRRGEGSAGS